MTAKDLKNAILQEAVQGKLVPQIASEGNARDLLEEIRKARGESLPLATARKRSSATPSAGSNAARNACSKSHSELVSESIPEDEIPFDIPESWCWCRLGEVCLKITDGTHKTPDYKDDGIKFVSAKNIKNGELSFEECKFISQEEHNELFKRCNPELNDILISKSGSIGSVVINKYDFEFSLFESLALVKTSKKLCNNTYFQFAIQYCCLNLTDEEIKGVAVKHLPLEAIKKLLIPLPPLAEQKRIVAAIEKFMPLIEEYGKKETVLNELNAQIGTLTKKAILQEAVQGKLVPQIPAEGNAKDLVASIACLPSFASKTSKKQLPPITEDEIPFDIPDSWWWCRLGEICKLIDGEKVKEVKLPLLDAKYLRGKKEATIVSEGKLANVNDLLILVDGENSGEVFVNKERGIMGSTFKQLYICEKLYLPYILKFIEMNKDLLRNSKKGAAIPHLNKDIFFGLPLPLPPLSEQKRIVAAIEHLLPLCEKLGK